MAENAETNTFNTVFNSLYMYTVVFIVSIHSSQSVVTLRVVPLTMHYINNREIYKSLWNINKDDNKLYINTGQSIIIAYRTIQTYINRYISLVRDDSFNTIGT